MNRHPAIRQRSRQFVDRLGSRVKNASEQTIADRDCLLTGCNTYSAALSNPSSLTERTDYRESVTKSDHCPVDVCCRVSFNSDGRSNGSRKASDVDGKARRLHDPAFHSRGDDLRDAVQQLVNHWKALPLFASTERETAGQSCRSRC